MRKGGLLGRPVEFVYYDDQTTPANVPKIYTKLLNVDNVDLVVSGYGTNSIAPAMPVVMRKKLVFMTLFGLAANEEYNYDRYFQIMPAGPNPKVDWSRGFIQLMKQNELQTLAWSAPMRNTPRTRSAASGSTRRRPGCRSSTTSCTRRARRTSRRSSGRSRRPTPMPSSSRRIRPIPPGWCGRRASSTCRPSCSAAAWSACSTPACRPASGRC